MPRSAQGAQTSIIIGKLLFGFDGRVRPDPRGSVELVDITPPLVERDAAGLTGAVGKDQDILVPQRRFLRHVSPRDVVDVL